MRPGYPNLGAQNVLDHFPFIAEACGSSRTCSQYRRALGLRVLNPVDEIRKALASALQPSISILDRSAPSFLINRASHSLLVGMSAGHAGSIFKFSDADLSSY